MVHCVGEVADVPRQCNNLLNHATTIFQSFYKEGEKTHINLPVALATCGFNPCTEFVLK